MNQHDEIQVAAWLRDGIAAARAGRRDEARELLMQVVAVNEDSELAWMWLSGVVDTDEDRLVCLENVLTLNPDNVQARAGLKWLKERQLFPERSGVGEQGVGSGEQASASPTFEATVERDADFLTPDGCAYCGLVVDESEQQCPHCGGQLVSMRFKQAERSSLARSLHVLWLLLAIVNLLDFVLIKLFWQSTDSALDLPQDYSVFIVGAVVSGDAQVEALLTGDQWMQAVRFVLVISAVLGALAALGLFLRRPRAHALALGLIALQLVLALALPVMGFSGYVVTLLRGCVTLTLIVALLQTVEDFSKEERREWLETDRFAVTSMDYYTQGHFYARQGMWAKALLHWQQALVKSTEGDKDSYFAAIARALAALGRYERALGQMDEAMRVSHTPQKWEALRETIVQAQRQAGEQ